MGTKFRVVVVTVYKNYLDQSLKKYIINHFLYDKYDKTFDFTLNKSKYTLWIRANVQNVIWNLTNSNIFECKIKKLTVSTFK